ncbi:hypothetical protein [Mesorhizobium sp. ORM16]|uniref:hypothetical protein n=1 Tax=Mesorhizobium sp. ORM16 TaxID=3376989 RepID=UPI00385776D2
MEIVASAVAAAKPGEPGFAGLRADAVACQQEIVPTGLAPEQACNGLIDPRDQGGLQGWIVPGDAGAKGLEHAASATGVLCRAAANLAAAAQRDAYWQPNRDRTRTH